MKIAILAVIFAGVFATGASASETLISEPDESSYHFVSHYSIEINASANEVWNEMIDLGSWMTEFDLILESGVAGQAGEVRRLYSGQEFFIEITKVISNELLVFANLPSELNGEHSTGVAVISLTENGATTTVKLTMSRRYSWDNEEPNPQRLMRETPEFQERTRSMWNERFLPKLKSLSES
ncbi:MAG: hypothetical protein AAFM91_08005 [Pseudomonadota bacterium]